jgi:hypothetical protein
MQTQMMEEFIYEKVGDAWALVATIGGAISLIFTLGKVLTAFFRFLRDFVIPKCKGKEHKLVAPVYFFDREANFRNSTRQPATSGGKDIEEGAISL